MLKFFDLEARFPSDLGEVGDDIVEFVARQVRVAPEVLGEYSLESRAATYHRSPIREAFGFRVCTRHDEADLARWLTGSATGRGW